MSFFFKPGKSDPPAMTLEGVLGPNSRLDEAEAVAVETPGALCIASDGRLLFSSGRSVHAMARWGERPAPWGRFERPVTALSASPGGLVAVGLTGGGIAVLDNGGEPSGWAVPTGAGAIADCLFLSEDELAVVDHGHGADADVLSVAPWDDAAHGTVTALDRSGGTRVIMKDLHSPMGICRASDGALLVTELERARVVDQSGRVRQSGLPAYLGRIRRTSKGYLLSCLSRRDPLIEFLKTETDFVAEMKAKIAPRHWIAPRVTPEFAHDFPIELGATRLFGEIKPWAPSFSYGLLIALGGDMMPAAAAHSRADGRRHAISDALVWNGDVIAVSKASGEILNLGPEADFE